MNHGTVPGTLKEHAIERGTYLPLKKRVLADETRYILS